MLPSQIMFLPMSERRAVGRTPRMAVEPCLGVWQMAVWGSSRPRNKHEDKAYTLKTAGQKVERAQVLEEGHCWTAQKTMDWSDQPPYVLLLSNNTCFLRKQINNHKNMFLCALQGGDLTEGGLWDRVLHYDGMCKGCNVIHEKGCHFHTS